MTTNVEREVSKERFFTHLVELFAPSLYRCALGLSHDRMQAEDLVQETYLRAWRFRAHLKNSHAAKEWLFTILRREHARHYQRTQLRISDVELENIPMDSTSAETHARLTLLQGAVANLPQAYRDPLTLYMRGGYTCEEIAKVLDLSSGAVWTRLHRARKLLIKQLGRSLDAPQLPKSSNFAHSARTTSVQAHPSPI